MTYDPNHLVPLRIAFCVPYNKPADADDYELDWWFYLDSPFPQEQYLFRVMGDERSGYCFHLRQVDARGRPFFKQVCEILPLCDIEFLRLADILWLAKMTEVRHVNADGSRRQPRQNWVLDVLDRLEDARIVDREDMVYAVNKMELRERRESPRMVLLPPSEVKMNG